MTAEVAENFRKVRRETPYHLAKIPLADTLYVPCAYQTRQALARTMGCPALQPKAFWN